MRLDVDSSCQFFDKPAVSKAVAPAYHSFNKREEDFSGKLEWDNYLEALEDIGELVLLSYSKLLLLLSSSLLCSPP